MKILFITLVSIGFMVSASAQSINKQIIAAAGNTTSNATHQLTSTLGEPVIGLKSATVSINQGFLAGATNNTTLSVEELVDDPTVSVYPNPVTDLVHINITNNTASVVATIYNVTGQQVASHKISTENQTLNISHLASGMYLVQLHFKDANSSKSFKIIKK